MALAPYKCSLFSWLKQSMPPVRNYLSLSGLIIILCLIVLDVSLYALKFHDGLVSMMIRFGSK